MAMGISTAIDHNGIISNPSKQPDVPTVGLYRKGVGTLHELNMGEVYNDLFAWDLPTSDPQEGEDPLEI
jgi:hypothetical protein